MLTDKQVAEFIGKIKDETKRDFIKSIVEVTENPESKKIFKKYHGMVKDWTMATFMAINDMNKTSVKDLLKEYSVEQVTKVLSLLDSSLMGVFLAGYKQGQKDLTGGKKHGKSKSK